MSETSIAATVEVLLQAAERTAFRAEECHARAAEWLEQRNENLRVAAQQRGAYAQAPWRAWASEAEERSRAWCMAGQVQMELARGDRARAMLAHAAAWAARQRARQHAKDAEGMTT